MDFPLIGSRQPLQLPFEVVGRVGWRAGAGLGGLAGAAGPRDRAGFLDGSGERRPCCMAGSMGDSGESREGSSPFGGAITLANCW